MAAKGSTNLTVYAFRKDGWDGDIEVTLKDAPEGFGLKNATIFKGKDQATITLTAPRAAVNPPVALRLEGHAVIDGATITRPIEEALKDIPGAVTIRSATGRGSAEISVFFDWHVDMIQSELYVLGRLAQIRSTLPSTTAQRWSKQMLLMAAAV